MSEYQKITELLQCLPEDELKRVFGFLEELYFGQYGRKGGLERNTEG